MKKFIPSFDEYVAESKSNTISYLSRLEFNQLLEKYELVDTHKEFRLTNGAYGKPVATLMDEYGGIAQIAIDDGCYVLYLGSVDKDFKLTSHIFPEAHEVLKQLPIPS